MEITQKQIDKLVEAVGKSELIKIIPDAFKTELEAGKWYIYSNCLLVWNNGLATYGFNGRGFWAEDYAFSVADARPATKEEIESALTKEADRIGFKSGAKIKPFNIKYNGIVDLQFKTEYKEDEKEFWRGGYCIFKEGKWATILPQQTELTLQQIAEKFNVPVDSLRIKY